MLSTIENLELFKDLTIWEYTREMEAIKKIGLNGDTMEKKEAKNRRERFEFYREKRLKNAINAIKLCQNMANKNSYEYTAEEGGMIIKYLEEAMRDLKHAFKGSQKKEGKYFE
jgi:hypothetical protein|tara:strand:+ start:304 stop:642 length:339 start_codon:yes stop_codon:yes gene_type:complete